MIPQAAAKNSTDPRNCIEALGLRIAEHVQFMCVLGTSVEVREKALAAVYERLVVMERQLGRIREGLQPG
jgi:hypothetical protein